MAESKLWMLTEAKEEAISKRENVLQVSQQVIENCYAVDWEKIRREIEEKLRGEK